MCANAKVTDKSPRFLTQPLFVNIADANFVATVRGSMSKIFFLVLDENCR